MEICEDDNRGRGRRRDDNEQRNGKHEDEHLGRRNEDERRKTSRKRGDWKHEGSHHHIYALTAQVARVRPTVTANHLPPREPSPWPGAIPALRPHRRSLSPEGQALTVPDRWPLGTTRIVVRGPHITRVPRNADYIMRGGPAGTKDRPGEAHEAIFRRPTYFPFFFHRWEFYFGACAAIARRRRGIRRCKRHYGTAADDPATRARAATSRATT